MSDDLVKRLRDVNKNYELARGVHVDISQAVKRIEELETLIKDFFILLDKKEETDDGRVFRPNHISSCRAEDGQKLENLLCLMKATVKGETNE